MNKIILPTIIVATVLVAGLFAMTPVEKASAVHTTLQTTIGTLQVVTDSQLVNWDQGEALTWTCTGDTVVYAIGLDLAAGNAGFQTTDDIDMTFDTGAGFDAVTIDADIFEGNAVADESNILHSPVDTDNSWSKISLINGGTVTVNLQNENATGDIQTGIGTLFAFSDGTCSAT